MSDIPRTVPAHLEIARQRDGPRPHAGGPPGDGHAGGDAGSRRGRRGGAAQDRRGARGPRGPHRRQLARLDRGRPRHPARAGGLRPARHGHARSRRSPSCSRTPRSGSSSPTTRRTREALEEIRDRVPTMGEIVAIDAQGRAGPHARRPRGAGRRADRLRRAGRRRPARRRRHDHLHLGHDRAPQGRRAHAVELRPPGGRGARRSSRWTPRRSSSRSCRRGTSSSARSSTPRSPRAQHRYTDRRRFKDDLREVPAHLRGLRAAPVGDRPRGRAQRGRARAVPLKRGLFKGAYAVASAHRWGRDRARGHILRVHEPRGIARPRRLRHARPGRGSRRGVDVAPRPARAARSSSARSGRPRADACAARSAGAACMPPHIDQFFRTIGVPILVGYGLTETSPVVAVRREERNVLGTIGSGDPGGRDPDPRSEDRARSSRPGESGLVFTRGPHVMQGYHHDEAAHARGHRRRRLVQHGRPRLPHGGGRPLLPRARQGDDRARRAARTWSRVAWRRRSSRRRSSSRSSSSARTARRSPPSCCRIRPQVAEGPRHISGRPDARGAGGQRRRAQAACTQEAVRTTAGLAPFERVTRFALLPKALDVARRHAHPDAQAQATRDPRALRGVDRPGLRTAVTRERTPRALLGGRGRAGSARRRRGRFAHPCRSLPSVRHARSARPRPEPLVGARSPRRRCVTPSS